MEIQWRRAAVYGVCRDHEHRLLLTRFPDTGRWTMPGGGMEWGESPEDTLHRELREETGLAGNIGLMLGVFSHWFTAEESLRKQAGHAIGLVYELHNVNGELRTEWPSNESTDGAAWFTLAEVQGLPTVPLVDFVLDLIT